jgi:hypothetical protein
VPPARQLLWVRAPDLRDLVVGIPEGGSKLDEGLAVAVAASTPLEIREMAGRGWAKTLELLRGEDDVDLLLTSVSSELTDPSPEPREGLIDLARFVQEDREGRVAVLNASSLVPGGTDARTGDDGNPLDLRIRQLNLAVMEASHATGLSVVDVDQLVAETRASGKVTGPFDYSPEVCDALRSRLVSVLDELGFAERPVMEARVPFVRQARELTVETWCKSEGDVVAAEDVICELRLANLRRMTRPTSAIMLASIEGRTPLLRSLLSRERERPRAWDAILSVVALESAVLRKILRPAGADVRSGDALAVLTRDLETPIDGSNTRRDTFRTAVRTADPLVGHLL